MASATLVLCACNDLPARDGVVCSPSLYQTIDYRLPVDSDGHGPDLGSSEWKHGVERKLGIGDASGFPERNTDAWCQRVYDLVRTR